MKLLTTRFSLKSIKTLTFSVSLVILASYSDLYAGCTNPPAPTVSPETNTTCTGTCLNFANAGGTTTALILQYDDNIVYTSPTQVVLATNATTECIVAAPGTTVFWRIRAVDCNGPCTCYSAYVSGDTVLIPACASIFALNPDEKIMLYPNPAADRIYLKNTDQQAIESIVIYDQTGRKMGEWKPEKVDYFDASNLRNGLYTAIISTKEGRFSEIISILH